MRTLTSGMQTAVAQEAGEICHFFELQFSGGTLYFTNAGVDLLWNGQTWTAVGGSLSFAPITETGDLSGGGVDLTLSGVDQSVLGVLLQEQYVGRSVKVWLAHLANGAIVADPALLFQGQMNGGWTVNETWPAKDRAGTCTITGRATDRLAMLNQRRGIQTNIGAHQAVYATDLFFSFVGQLTGQQIVWKAK